MIVSIITPIPIEFQAAKEALDLQVERELFAGCRAACGRANDIDLFCLQSGPGKARAAQAAAASIARQSPDLILDTGTCAGIRTGLEIGDIILAGRCFEIDIGGQGIPVKKIREMELDSVFTFLPPETAEVLACQAGACGKKQGMRVFEGMQASGELLVNSPGLKKSLADLFQAAGANWETAGVYVSALRSSVPAFSLRAVSDLGDGRALEDFRIHARGAAETLYRFIKVLIEDGWFTRFLEEWEKVPSERKRNMPVSVRP